jgi:acyl dehydratase
MANYGQIALAVAKKHIKGHRRLPYALPDLSLKKSGMTIDMNHVKEYCDVCGFANNLKVPIIYPAIMCRDIQVQLMVNEGFPFPVLGLVHLANRIEQYSVIDASSKLHLNVQLGKALILHDKGYCCDLICEFHCEKTGNLVWKNIFTLFNHNKRDKTNDDPNTLYESQIKESDLQGLKEVNRWDVPSNKGRQYARVSGDYNPIHLHASSAYLFGFTQGAIMHGMWTKARAIADLMPPVDTMQPPLSGDGKPQPLSEIFVEFKTPLYLPSSAVLSSKSTQTAFRSDDTSSGMVYKEERVFEVKGAGGDKLPHMRGKCWWYGDGTLTQ